MTTCLVGACVMGGYILGASVIAFILGAHRKFTPLPFQLPETLDCRACIFVETLKKQHAELCRAWAELEKR